MDLNDSLKEQTHVYDYDGFRSITIMNSWEISLCAKPTSEHARNWLGVPMALACSSWFVASRFCEPPRRGFRRRRRQALFPIFRDHEWPAMGFARQTCLTRRYFFEDWTNALFPRRTRSQARWRKMLVFESGRNEKSGRNESRLPRLGGDSSSQTIERRG